MARRLVKAVLGLPVAGLVLAATTQAQDVTVTIDGTTRTDKTHPCPAQPKCVDVAGDYTNMKIAPINTGFRARVEVLNDGGSDTIQMANAKITAKEDIPSNSPVHIIFQYQHGPGPTTNYYKAMVYGTSSNTHGNSISIKAWYTGSDANTQIGTIQTHTVTCGDMGCNTNLNLTTSTAPTRLNPGVNPRTLQMNAWVTMAKDSTLSLSSGLKVWESAAPDIRPTPSPCGIARSSLGITCATTHWTGQAFGCPACVREEGTVAQSAKATLFAHTIWDNLSEELARGGGEHLASLASLLNVSDKRRGEFFAMAQDEYAALARAGTPEPEAMLAALESRLTVDVNFPSRLGP